MVSLFRLKGRALQLDNSTIMLLSFFTGIVLLVTVNFLPALYEGFIISLFSFEKELLADTVNFLAASLFLGTAFGGYSAVRLGIKRYLLKKAQKKKPGAGDIFFYFMPKRFFQALLFSLRISLVRLILLIFCCALPIICFVILNHFFRQGASALVCITLSMTAVLLFINARVFYSLFNSSFFLCDYYFIEGSYVSFRHLISCSQRDMRRKNTLLTRLKLSFAGWFVLCLLILPIPYVWGYYNQSLAVAAAEFMKGKGD